MSTPNTLLAAGFWLLAANAFALQIPPPGGGPARSLELRERRAEILVKEKAALQALADRWKKEGKADLGGPDKLDVSSADGSSRFVPLPEVVASKDLKAIQDGPPERSAIRLETAKALFELATEAAKPPESFGLADECLRGVIERQPDHAEARRLLGFVPLDGGWATPFAADKLARGFVLDTTYGWVKADWVPHLRKGELPDRSLKRWLPTAEADALRRDWSTKWEISTEHFRIGTNVPLNEAISFGRKLEDLHQLFFALMADVIDPARLPLAQRFKRPDLKPAASANAKTVHSVYYFATREEYARFLEPLQGEGSKLSLGTYVPRKESKTFGATSYFFNDIGGQLDVTSTLYHEGSHQLLFETAGPDDYARNSGQFWVFEGLGTYFETLRHEPDGSLRIGGLVGPRIAQAKRRLVEGTEFIPIEQLVSYSRPRFQGDVGGGDIFLNYAESMALTVFLMQADGERHREGFLDYIRDAYKGRFRGGSGRSLEEQVGTRYPELDRAFLAYLARAARP